MKFEEAQGRARHVGINTTTVPPSNFKAASGTGCPNQRDKVDYATPVSWCNAAAVTFSGTAMHFTIALGSAS